MNQSSDAPAISVDLQRYCILRLYPLKEQVETSLEGYQCRDRGCINNKSAGQRI